MERESLLAMLILLLGGLALQTFAAWPVRALRQSAARRLERQRWLALWRPVTAASVVAAWLIGWALSQPDPVPHQVGWILVLAPTPFVLIALRAIARAAWALLRSHRNHGIATVGLLRPHVVLPPEIAGALDPQALHAALEHERAHVRHRDPLRIWLAQLATDLQWPRSSAQSRLSDWLAALEVARDDEARLLGTDGADLAAAVLGSVRFQQRCGAMATLIGRPEALPARIDRLLAPLLEDELEANRKPSIWLIASLLLLALLGAVVLGHACGERLIDPLLRLSYLG